MSQETFDPAHPRMLEPRLDRSGRELVAALFGSALGVVGQPVFVGVDSDEVLEGAGQSDFFVGFELGQVDEDIGLHGRST